jgi:hypothetical protein
MLQGHRERHERGSEGAAAGGHHVGAGMLELVVVGAERERGQERSRREEDPLARGGDASGAGVGAEPVGCGTAMEGWIGGGGDEDDGAGGASESAVGATNVRQTELEVRKFLGPV